MSFVEAIVLGLIQGITEFLPVSSDGHLALAGFLMEMRELPLSAVVLMHAGTLLATLLVMRRELVQLLEGSVSNDEGLFSAPRKELMGIVLASIPTVIIGLSLEHSVSGWAQDPRIVGVCLLGTAGFLLLTRRPPGTEEVLRLRHYVAVGVAQGFAVLPGLSRSASTIALAMALGLSPRAAFRFSFLLSLPAVGGAVLLEGIKPEARASLDPMAAVGAVVAFFSGLVALLFLRRVISKGNFWSFALYVVPLGLGLLAWGLFGAGQPTAAP
jgi:undecaprenyl-diphosphatase